jgi:hypothetical protein
VPGSGSPKPIDEVSSAAREAARETLQSYLIPLAAFISLLAGLVVLLSGQSIVTAVGCGVAVFVSVIAAFLAFFNSRLRARLGSALHSKDELLNGRDALEARARDAEARAKDRDALEADLKVARERATGAEARAGTLDAERAKLASSLADAQKEVADFRGRVATLTGEKVAAETAAAAAAADARRFSGELQNEPLVRPSVEVVPGRWFQPRNVLVVVENVGPGNAQNVQVTGGGGNGPAPIPGNPINFYPAIRPGERFQIVLGTVNDFAAAEWVGVEVSYAGPFGRIPPVGIRRSLR